MRHSGEPWIRKRDAKEVVVLVAVVVVKFFNEL